MSRLLHIAGFEGEASLVGAARECRALDLEMVDAHTPYPVHAMDEAIGIRRTRLPMACLIGGLLGLGGALGFQFWASAADWPVNVGGKPFQSWPAFAPVAFETMVLFAGLATAFAFWARSGLWPGRKPRRPLAGATDDRFYLVVASRGAAVDPARIEQTFRDHGAGEYWQELEEER